MNYDKSSLDIWQKIPIFQKQCRYISLFRAVTYVQILHAVLYNCKRLSFNSPKTKKICHAQKLYRRKILFLKTRRYIQNVQKVLIFSLCSKQNCAR
jgi:hypothetical protein